MGSRKNAPEKPPEEDDRIRRMLATEPHDPWWKVLTNLTLRTALLAAAVAYNFTGPANPGAAIGVSVILLLPVYDALAAMVGKIRVPGQPPRNS